jgi:hypothetical protein
MTSAGRLLRDDKGMFNLHRRWARSQVAVKRLGLIRKARPTEVKEHGCWRHTLPMVILYLAFSVWDRVAITCNGGAGGAAKGNRVRDFGALHG